MATVATRSSMAQAGTLRAGSSVATPAAVTVRAAGRDGSAAHAGLHNRVVLARIGPVTVVNFGVLAAVGGALATWVALARQQQAGMHPQQYAAALFVVLPLMAVLGSRAFSLALEWRQLLTAPLATVFKPGFAFQGGLVGAAAGLVAVARYAHVDTLMLMDTLAFGLPLGHAVGRLACYTYGCCHGRPTHLPLAIRYTNPDSKAVRCSHLAGVPLHPTQLYSAAGNLLLFAALAALASGPVRAGEIAAAYLILASSGRFFVEFVRGEATARPAGLSPFQWVSLASAACGVGLLYAGGGSPAHVRFCDVAALDAALRYAGASVYPAVVFLVIFVCFGLQGRQVGSFVSSHAAEQPAAHRSDSTL